MHFDIFGTFIHIGRILLFAYFLDDFQSVWRFDYAWDDARGLQSKFQEDRTRNEKVGNFEDTSHSTELLELFGLSYTSWPSWEARHGRLDLVVSLFYFELTGSVGTTHNFLVFKYHFHQICYPSRFWSQSRQILKNFEDLIHKPTLWYFISLINPLNLLN